MRRTHRRAETRPVEAKMAGARSGKRRARTGIGGCEYYWTTDATPMKHGSEESRSDSAELAPCIAAPLSNPCLNRISSVAKTPHLVLGLLTCCRDSSDFCGLCKQANGLRRQRWLSISFRPANRVNHFWNGSMAWRIDSKKPGDPGPRRGLRISSAPRRVNSEPLWSANWR